MRLWTNAQIYGWKLLLAGISKDTKSTGREIDGIMKAICMHKVSGRLSLCGRICDDAPGETRRRSLPPKRAHGRRRGGSAGSDLTKRRSQLSGCCMIRRKSIRLIENRPQWRSRALRLGTLPRQVANLVTIVTLTCFYPFVYSFSSFSFGVSAFAFAFAFALVVPFPFPFPFPPLPTASKDSLGSGAASSS